jgi:hypothetical protein
MRGLVAALALVLGACAREPEPVPPPTPAATATPEPSELRPLTSRDSGGEPAAARPSELPPLPPGHPRVDSSTAPAGPAITGRVELAPSLARRSGAALFVIARRASSQEIVAVRKEAVGAFPITFSISGADAMTAGTSFEGPLDVTARLSQSGDAVPAKGDVEGVVRALAPGARDVRIVLDSVRQ